MKKDSSSKSKSKSKDKSESQKRSESVDRTPKQVSRKLSRTNMEMQDSHRYTFDDYKFLEFIMFTNQSVTKKAQDLTKVFTNAVKIQYPKSEIKRMLE